jgi:hypothetical protein
MIIGKGPICTSAGQPQNVAHSLKHTQTGPEKQRGNYAECR